MQDHPLKKWKKKFGEGVEKMGIETLHAGMASVLSHAYTF